MACTPGGALPSMRAPPLGLRICLSACTDAALQLDPWLAHGCAQKNDLSRVARMHRARMCPCTWTFSSNDPPEKKCTCPTLHHIPCSAPRCVRVQLCIPFLAMPSFAPRQCLVQRVLGPARLQNSPFGALRHGPLSNGPSYSRAPGRTGHSERRVSVERAVLPGVCSRNGRYRKEKRRAGAERAVL